jgi:hypothetical protein
VPLPLGSATRLVGHVCNNFSCANSKNIYNSFMELNAKRQENIDLLTIALINNNE